MKRLLAVLCVLAMVLTLVPMTAFAGGDVILPPDEFADETIDFAVLSTTDMHGKCWDTNVLTDGTESNNMLKVKTAVNKIRQEFDNVILVDNGDLYQGTPVSSVQLNKYTQGLSEDPLAMAVCLADIGYDASVLGNHEFNYSWTTMQDARAYLAEQGVSTICANLYYEETGENVFTPYITKAFKVGSLTFRVGILGLESTDCTRWDIPDNYPGIIFHHPDNPECSIAWEVEHYVPMMKAEGCNFIIVSYHGGTGSATGDLVFGVNTEGQATRMIAETTGVDMVIAGHDHSASYSNTYIKNKDGEDVLIVNGGGTQLTKTVFTATQNGYKVDVKVKSSQNITLSSYASDASLKEKIKPYADMASEYVNQEAGKCIGTWDKETNFYLKQSDSMDMIQAAQMYEGSKYIAQKYDTPEKQAALFEATGLDHLDIDMSSTSVVVNGSYTVKTGTMTMKDIYRLYKYDNNLYVLPLTGAQIKAILEQNASTRLKATVKNGNVTYSTIGEDFTNPVFGGLNFTYDMYQPEGSRVIIDGFANGRAFDLNKVYLVGVNNYHLGNVGCGFGAYSTDDSIWSQTDDMGGGVVQDLIMEYLTDMTKENGGVDPATFNWTWKLDYTGDPSEEQGITGTIIGKEVTELHDGQRIMIYSAAADGVMSSEPAANAARLDVVPATVSGQYLGTNDPALFLTVVEVPTPGAGPEVPMNYAFKTDSGNYLTSGATGNSLGFSAELTDLSLWYPEEVDGGFHIMNVGAAYNGNHNQALEWYTGFTTYGVQNTAAYLFNIYEPVETASVTDEVKDGGRYAIYYDAEGTFLSTEDLNGGLAPVTNTVAGGQLLLPAADSTLIINAEIVATNGEDPIFIFKTDDGKYLTSGDTGNALFLGDNANDMAKWYLVAVDGGWHIMNVGAAYNGNHNQAIEYYNGKFTTYGVKDTAIYVYNFYEMGEHEVPPEPCPHDNTDLFDVSEPTCTEPGYTGDVYCLDCDELITEGTVIPATGHSYVEGVCENCGEPCPHENTELRDAKEPTCTELGYTGDTYCLDCGMLVTSGEPIRETGHLFHNGYCEVCGAPCPHDNQETYGYEPATCTEEGHTGDTYCLDCDMQLTMSDIIDPLGHDFVDGYCSRCGEPDPTIDTTTDPCEDYTDINRSMWYHSAVDHVIKEGLMGSTSTEALTFEPMTKVSRCMVASILYRIAGEGAEVEYQGIFTDVPAGKWYTPAIEWCAQNGLASGKGDGIFDPMGDVTRQELAVFMYKLAEHIGRDVSGRADLSSFADASSVLNWSKDYLAWAVDAGIISGQAEDGKTYLNPTAGAMRCELASILMRFLMTE